MDRYIDCTVTAMDDGIPKLFTSVAHFAIVGPLVSYARRFLGKTKRRAASYGKPWPIERTNQPSSGLFAKSYPFGESLSPCSVSVCVCRACSAWVCGEAPGLWFG